MKSDSRIHWGIWIPMRDGTRISADLYLPEGDGKSSAIVYRTPYGKNEDRTINLGKYFSGHGFAVVICDVRGRGDSEGEFMPYFNEADDGYDVIEWVASQPWCTGSVGTSGASYLARIQWTTALRKPPHLKAMICTVSPSDPFVESPTGVPDPIHISWSFLVSGRALQNVNHVKWDEVYRHLPLYTMDEMTGREIREWKPSFEHTTMDDHWRRIAYQDSFSSIDLPVLHISGWYDDEQVGTPLNYSGMRRNAGSEKAREGQRLIMGPWPHRVNSGTSIGSVDFGSDAVIDLLDRERRWFDRWLNGQDNGTDGEKKVSIFVMGDNRWRDEEDWPLPDTRYTPYYFHSNGRANSRFGDGTLDTVKPRDEPMDSYTHDPGNPVPFITDPTFAQIGGPDDYSSVERRDDVLVFTSEPVDRRTEITGPVKAVLYVSSDCRDTDFTVKLLDVWPNGYSQRLCDGIVRGRFRDGMEHEVFMEPGEVYRMELDMWNTCMALGPGHSIRVEVASSAFPKYSINQNTAEPLGMTANIKKAEQKLYHAGERASHVLLPVVDR